MRTALQSSSTLGGEVVRSSRRAVGRPAEPGRNRHLAALLGEASPGHFDRDYREMLRTCT